MRKLSLDFVVDSDKHGYGYQWTWLGLPFIQMPQDILVTQEIIWETKPDVIIETGIAWGGSVVFYASLLQLLGKGEVIAVDLNLYDHVTEQIMSYPFSNRIHLYKGSSTAPSVAAQIKTHEARPKVMVLLISEPYLTSTCFRQCGPTRRSCRAANISSCRTQWSRGYSARATVRDPGV